MSFRRLSIYTLIVGGGFAASKLLGLLRDIIIARTFGTSAPLDAYVAAFNFPGLLFALIPGGALASVFIPVLSGYIADDARREEGWRLASAVVNLVLVIVAALSLLAAIAAPWLVGNIIAPRFDPARQALTADLMRLVLISTLIFSLSGVVTGILHAHNSFVLPALAPSLYNLGIIAGAIFLAPRFGVYGLGYGVVAGAAAHLLIQVPGLIRRRARYFWTFGMRSAGVGELIRLFLPRVVTLGVVQANVLLMTNLASGLQVGSVAGLNYAYLIWQFPESLIGTATALAVFPTLSRLASQGALDRLRRLFDTTMGIIIGLAVPAALIVVVLARPLVALILQRGAFQSGSTEIVAGILQVYALAVIGESALELAARIFYARHDSITPMFVALGSMALRALLMFNWVGEYGASGLALAYVIGVTAEAATLYGLARSRLRRAALAVEVAS